MPLDRNYEASGTIDALNGKVVLNAENMASAIIEVVGTFNGVLTVTGTGFPSSASNVDGGRLVFKSGVGSLGENKIRNDGKNISNEYRIVAGGQSIKVEATEWTSGSCFIKITSSISPSIMFINGPVHTAEEESIRDSRGFAAATGAQSVGAGNIIACTFKNPADSGVNVFLRRRLFGNNRSAGDTNLEYIAYGDPTFEPLNQENGLNLKGVTPFSSAEFKWQVDAAQNITMGGVEGTGEILPNGSPYCRELDFVLNPGRGVGFVIQGDGNNILQAVRLSIILEWYEELVN